MVVGFGLSTRGQRYGPVIFNEIRLIAAWRKVLCKNVHYCNFTHYIHKLFKTKINKVMKIMKNEKDWNNNELIIRNIYKLKKESIYLIVLQIMNIEEKDWRNEII